MGCVEDLSRRVDRPIRPRRDLVVHEAEVIAEVTHPLGVGVEGYLEGWVVEEPVDQRKALDNEPLHLDNV